MHRFNHRAFVGSAGLWLLLGACDGSGPDTASTLKREKTQVSGPIVATVDGEPISLSEVQELVDATGLSPREALERLEDERLLASYAEQRGYGQDSSSQRDLQRARARALLANAVEASLRPEDMPAADVKARFEVIKARDQLPDTRSVTHVLFKTVQGKDGAKAKAAAEALLRQARDRASLEDQVALFESIPAQGDQDGVAFLRESFDAAQDGKFEKSFADGAFELPGTGVVPRLVETSFGFHVILVRALKPAVVPELTKYEEGIRKQLATEKRKVRLDTLVETLKAKDPVVLDEALIKRAMSDESLLGSAP